MKEEIIKRFIGISCAWLDPNGKEESEYFGFADKEKQIRYCTECPLNWGGKCCHHAIRFWV